MEQLSGPPLCSKVVYASFIVVFFGIGIGWLVKSNLTLTEIHYEFLALPGELLLQMLQFLAVPLIFANVATAVLHLHMSANRKLMGYSVVYFGITNLMAAITGVDCWVLMKQMMQLDTFTGTETEARDYDDDDDEDFWYFSLIWKMVELMLNLFPTNPLGPCFQKYKLELHHIPGDDPDYSEVEAVGHFVDGYNIMGLVTMAMCVGFCVKYMGGKSRIMAKNIDIIDKAAKTGFRWVRWFMPICLMSFIITTIVEGQEWESLLKLARVTAVILLGLGVHGAITLPLLYFLFTWKDPRHVLKGVSPALFSAFAASSSSATMPQTLHCCEERLKLNRGVTRLVLPLGATINMNGIALFEVVAVLTITQLSKVQVDLSQTATILVTAAAFSLGASGVPATGAMTTIFILTAVGLPAREAISLLAVEWILDRFKAAVNVLGDCICAAVCDAWLRQARARAHGAEDGEEHETEVWDRQR
ncbi:excitatory amino acid transporter 3-like [Halichoeres trimaculatus]|uniref:excitatory amino acid transporter 3-like n=1 Tax=Halichoeres trimaculatus TaxID=147232 RepID=UPI003D9E3BBB